MNLEFKNDLENLYNSVCDSIDGLYDFTLSVGKTAYYSIKILTKAAYKITYDVVHTIYTSETIRNLYRKVKEYDYKNLWIKLKKLICGVIIATTIIGVGSPIYNTYATNEMNNKPSIMLDLAHLDNERDNGASYLGYNEREIVNDITIQLSDRLQDLGYNIKFTRDYNTPISLNNRIELANSQDNDFYISIHANSSKTKNNGGVEVYCSKGGDAEILANEITKNISDDLNMNNRGVKDDIYYTRHIKDKTGVIAEIGFINNESDLNKMINEKDKFVSSLVNSIENTYKTKDITNISYQHEVKKPTKTFDMVKLQNGEWDFVAVD